LFSVGGRNSWTDSRTCRLNGDPSRGIRIRFFAVIALSFEIKRA
jgi:hypothetical protein